MQITRVTARGLKVPNFSDEYGPVTIISGPNATGKTARLDAIRLALLGYIPELGKGNQATAQLARGSSLEVELDIEAGGWRRITRRWLCKDGRWTKQEHGECEIPAILLDPRTFFDLGEKDKVRYVFERCPINTTIDEILTKVKNVRLEPHTEDHEAVIRQLVDELDKADMDRFEAGQDFGEWLRGRITDLRERARVAKGHAERMKKTVQGLTVLTDVSATEQKALEAKRELEKLVLKRDALRHELATVAERLRMARKTMAQREDLRANLDDRAKENIEELTRKIEALRKEPKADPDKLEAASQKQIKAGKALAKAEAELTGLKNERARVAKELAEVEQCKTCPFCGTPGEEWKERRTTELKAKLADLDSEIEDRAAKIASLREKSTAAADEMAAAKEALNRATRAASELVGLEHTLASLRRKMTEGKALLQSIPDDIEDQIAELVGAEKRLTEKTGKIESQMRQLEQMHRDWVQSCEKAKLEAQSIEAARKAQAEADAMVAVVDALEEHERDLAHKAIDSLVGRINGIVQPILRWNLSFRDGQFGRYDETGWIPLAAFSGTEQAVTFAAVSLVLSEGSPLRLVMLDELGRLDAERKTQLLITMQLLVKNHVIDQFIGVDTSTGDFDGVTVIKTN